MAEISAVIKTKMQAIQISGDDAFASVLEHARGEKNSYPCAEILPTGGSTVKRIAMGGLNSRTFIFRISLYQEQSEQGKTSAEATARAVAISDAVIHAFDTDPDLGNEVETCMLNKMDFDFTGSRTPGLFATFDLECAIITTNYEIP